MAIMLVSKTRDLGSIPSAPAKKQPFIAVF